MSIRNLIRWNKPTALHAAHDPFRAFHAEFDRLVNDLFSGMELEAFRPFRGLAPFGETAWPSVNVAESDSEITVTAEAPGLDDKDIEVLVAGNTLTLKGEKKHESEDKGRHYYRSERSYGRFERTIPLPAEVNWEKAEAHSKNGLLTVTLPKTQEAKARRKQIEVKMG